MEQALQSCRTAGRDVQGWAVEAKRKSNGGKESKDSTQDRKKASKTSKWILAMRNRREWKAQMSQRRWVDWRKYRQAEEVQASSER